MGEEEGGWEGEKEREWRERESERERERIIQTGRHVDGQTDKRQTNMASVFYFDSYLATIFAGMLRSV